MSQKSEPTKTYQFEILRYGGSGKPRFQAYALSVDRKMSVLEGLLQLQDEQDPSLAFRYACRGAVCGSCAMSINGRLNLACRVQLQTLEGGRVVLEPLPCLDLIRDLVVNLEPFWKKYEKVRPWLHSAVAAVKENRMSEAQRERIDQYTHCILCAACYASCPGVRFNADFLGPAAAAKLDRFLVDSRDSRDGVEIAAQNSENGVWGCRNVMECVRVCPKDVRPADGVRGVRRKLVKEKTKGLLGRKSHET
jgi:succinate dehydrogenase / fumarate reductase, iron-sulfur subunit